ncbi:MAG: hypothetical protein ACQEUI_10770, partial [Actinomycetota bacterium]
VAERDAARAVTEAALAVDAPSAHAAGTRPGTSLHPTRPLAVVAVLHGVGAVALARSLGAEVVDGTAGALPSVAQLVEGIVSCRASRVLVLPGHRNGVAAARAAADVAAREHELEAVVIDAATSPPAVLAALALWEPGADPGQVTDEVLAAAAAVRGGEVVDAVRDAATSIGPVRAGQPLALVDGGLVAAAEQPLEALAMVCRALEVDHAEVVTLLHGSSASPQQRQAAADLVIGMAPDAEVEVVDAGVAPARFWVGVE